jgi:hypothetical protein
LATAVVRDSERPKFDQDFFDPNLKQKIEKMWHFNPSQRINLNEMIDFLNKGEISLASSNQNSNQNSINNSINSSANSISGSIGLTDNLKNKKIEEWKIEDVVEWMECLNLEKDYSKIIEKNEINGEALIEMSVDDWKELEIPIGPRARIFGAIKRLQEKK